MNSPLPLIRKKNIQYRSREYLTLAEVNKIVAAAGSRGRHRERQLWEPPQRTGSREQCDFVRSMRFVG
ncbi:MAG: hypothetical protein HWQ38_01180 [Nostoc sp. NMS7]|uniref:hypothetical protein n=1 Tax=Nostoc sp. NMS7 TaxID=2815391 RepID=UPI0025F74BED|nr:hypothetical protein [Nostoc sp. NMS7]MBN3945162.1 hypothetical protein [Nostoc sp. NMS7]